MAESSTGETPVAAARPSGGWFLVIMLTIIAMYAFVDRQIISLLVAPIQKDLSLSDTEMSAVLGLAFVVSYSLLNIPAGILVDRLNRKWLLTGAGVFWSSMTMMCGLAGNVWQLIAARSGIGLGEAVVGPAAFSLIRDAIPPKRRNRAFSIYNTGLFLGSAVALIGGGALFGAAASGAFDSVPVLGSFKPWQIVLLLVGAIGFPISMLLLLIKEPARIQDGDKSKSFIGFGDAIAHFNSRRAVYLWLLAYVALQAAIALGSSVWLPAMIGRKLDLSPQDIGPILGVIVLVCGPIGSIGAGFVMDHIASRGGDVRQFGLVGTLCSTIGIVGASLAPNALLTWVFVALTISSAAMFQIVGAATLSHFTPSANMGKFTAIYLLAQNFIGQGLGPLLPALLSDNVFAAEGRMALPYACAVAFGVLGMAALVCLLGLIRAVRRSPPEQIET